MFKERSGQIDPHPGGSANKERLSEKLSPLFPSSSNSPFRFLSFLLPLTPLLSPVLISSFSPFFLFSALPASLSYSCLFPPLFHPSLLVSFIITFAFLYPFLVFYFHFSFPSLVSLSLCPILISPFIVSSTCLISRFASHFLSFLVSFPLLLSDSSSLCCLVLYINITRPPFLQ